MTLPIDTLNIELKMCRTVVYMVVKWSKLPVELYGLDVDTRIQVKEAVWTRFYFKCVWYMGRVVV
jgi:hypothetical protein